MIGKRIRCTKEQQSDGTSAQATIIHDTIHCTIHRTRIFVVSFDNAGVGQHRRIATLHSYILRSTSLQATNYRHRHGNGTITIVTARRIMIAMQYVKENFYSLPFFLDQKIIMMRRDAFPQ